MLSSATVKVLGFLFYFRKNRTMMQNSSSEPLEEGLKALFG
jgi:hypothetical protein